MEATAKTMQTFLVDHADPQELHGPTLICILFPRVNVIKVGLCRLEFFVVGLTETGSLEIDLSQEMEGV